MKEENDPKSMQEKVLSAIEQGRVKQRPKWQFAAETALLTAGVVVTILVLLFLVSFLVFVMRQNGLWFAPAFGFAGLWSMFINFPWLFIAFAALAVILLEYLLRRYEFGYKKPVLYTFLGVVVVAGLGGVLVSRLHFHEGMAKRTLENKMPFGTPFYKKFSQPNLDEVTPGIVEAKTEQGFKMRCPREREDEFYSVQINSKTKIPAGTEFVVGDSVVVMGKKDKGTIQAWGIRKIEPRRIILPMPMPPVLVQ